MDFVNTWQFNLVGYIISAVFFNQFYKLAVRGVVKDGAATIILQSIAGVSALLLFPFFDLRFPTDFKIYALLTVACIFYALNDRIHTTIRKNMEVSYFAIINQLSSVFLIIIGLTFFKEPLSLFKILGAALILFANVLLRYSGGKFQFNKYVWLALLANFVFAIAVSIDVDISKHFNLPFYIMFTLIVPTVMIKIIERIPILDIKNEFTSGNKKYYFLTGFSWALLILFMLRAYQLSSFTLITPLSSTTVLLNVLVATVLLKERTNIAKKVVSALLVIAGVYLTVLR